MNSTGTATVSGIGIHSGVSATVRLTRRDGDIAFRRGAVEIPATYANIGSTDRTTVLVAGGSSIGMVEHVGNAQIDTYTSVLARLLPSSQPLEARAAALAPPEYSLPVRPSPGFALLMEVPLLDLKPQFAALREERVNAEADESVRGEWAATAPSPL